MSIDLSIPRSEPPREIFADEGGEPKDLNVTDFDARAAAACCSEIAEQLDNLTHLITTSPDAPALLGLDKLTSLEENWRTSRRQDPSEAPLSGLLIEELLPDEDKTQEKDINPARSSLPTAVAIFLASMQWGDLQETTSSALERPWVTSSTRTVSINLLTVLFQHVQLVSLLPRMVAALRPAITAAAVHAATETSRLEPYTGPDSWQRSLAMGQLAAAVQWLTTKELWQQNEEESKSGGGGDVLWQVYLFPVLTLAVQDPSPIVQKYALWTLHHIFTISTAKELAPWAGKLVEITRKAIVGCDEKVWPAAAAAATSLALKLDNGGGVASLSSTIPAYNPHFISLFEALLNEGERHAHNPPRVRVWLQTIPLALFPLLGIQLTRYFRRLMPLLLEWCVSIHKGVRLGALRAVHAVVRATWPRLPAHAAIWTVLESVYLDETVLSANTSEEIVREIVDIAVVLWKCGGETFQQQKLASVKGAAAHVDESGAGEKVASSLLERALSAVKSMEEVDIDVHTALCAVKIEEL
jgi:hypothetical protein